jgi:hypothetical protein
MSLSHHDCNRFLIGSWEMMNWSSLISKDKVEIMFSYGKFSGRRWLIFLKYYDEVEYGHIRDFMIGRRWIMDYHDRE